MRVLMVTNTYGRLGGVTSLVKGFSTSLVKLGHQVMIVAPSEDRRATAPSFDDERVLRVPAVNLGEFSAPLASATSVIPHVKKFAPQIIHSHHHVLLGSVALEVGRALGVPVVYGWNTLYEHYMHNLHVGKIGSPSVRLASAVAGYVAGATGPARYANRCAALLVPTKSVAKLSRDRGVTVPSYIVPYGIDLNRLAGANRERGRKRHRLSPNAFVVGHVGRFSPEKNLDFLFRSLSLFLRQHPQAYAVIVGKGSEAPRMKALAAERGVSSRIRWTGPLGGQDLADVYSAMDVFAFASTSETQGIVLAEAMAAGVPVIGVDGPGTRDIVDGTNGVLVPLHEEAFATALAAWHAMPKDMREAASRAARTTGASYDQGLVTKKLVAVYEDVLARPVRHELPSP